MSFQEISPPTPWQESARLSALAGYNVLDTPREADFDEIVSLAAAALDAPIAVVNFIESERQWFKAEIGIGQRELPLDVSICRHAILQPGVFIVRDLTKDARFDCNPLITPENGLRFYAGALLETPDGLPIGTLCVLDTKTRPEGLSPKENLTLTVLARQVMTQLELRRIARLSEARALELEARDRERLVSESKLRLSEERYRSLFNALQSGFGIVKLAFDDENHPVDYQFIEVNQAFEKQTGLYDVTGKNMRALAPTLEQIWFDKFGNVALTGEHARFETQAMPLGGRWFDVNAFRVGAAAAHHVAILLENTTARRAAEAAVRDSEAFLRLVIDSSSEAFYAVDKNGKTTLCNDAFLKITGFASQDEVVGRKLHGVIHHSHPDGSPYALADCPIHRAAATGSSAAIDDEVFFRADGTSFPVEYRAEPIVTNGAQQGAVCTFRDITQRRAAEMALRRSELRLRDLNDNLARQVAERTADRDRMWRLSTDLMLVTTLSGNITAINPAWETLLGWAESELLGKLFLDLVHPDDVATAAAEADKLMQGMTVFRFECRYRRKDGSYCTLSWTAVPDDGLVSAVGRDVTNERLAQAARDQLQEQLRQSQKMEAVGQLTGGLAHDFNNILMSISGGIELSQTRLAQGRLDDLERYLTGAQDSVKRAASLTHRLLAFSRRQTLEPKPTNINRLITGMEDLVCRTVGPSIHLEVIAAPDLWTTLVDAPQLENALLNLCINARDAMPDGGRITIETFNKQRDQRGDDHGAGEYVTMSVTDTGTGMSPETMALIFDPFFTTKPTGEGTGLGLSMIQGFAIQSGGQVRVRSTPRIGTIFCLDLPRCDDVIEPEKIMLKNPRAGGSGEVVLVIDDEPSIRMIIADVLADLGYATLEASDGTSGLQILQSVETRIDLVITDVGLPGGMNGRQVVDAGRLSRPDLKVLFITGYAEQAIFSNDQVGTGMHVLAKPFSMEVLAARIKELIND